MHPYGAGAGDDRRYSLLPTNSPAIAHSAAPPLHRFAGKLSTVPPPPSLYALESSRKLEEEVRREPDPLRARAMAERLQEVQLLGLLPPTASGTPRRPLAPEPTLGQGPSLLPYGSLHNDSVYRVAGPSLLPYSSLHNGSEYKVVGPSLLPYSSLHNDSEYRVAGTSLLPYSSLHNDSEYRVAGRSPSNSVSDPDSGGAEEEYPPRGGHSDLRPSRRVQEKMDKIKKMFGQEALAAPLEEKEAPPPAVEHCYRCGRDGHILTACDLSNQDILGYKRKARAIRKRKSRAIRKRQSRCEESV